MRSPEIGLRLAHIVSRMLASCLLVAAAPADFKTVQAAIARTRQKKYGVTKFLAGADGWNPAAVK